MRTFQQMHDDCNKAGWPCGYHGEFGEFLVLLGQSRDSDCLEQSNFRSALAMLGGEGNDVAIEREGHWACGWVEHLLVRAKSPAAATAEDILSRLADYPILNEDDHSQLEWEECAEVWANCYMPKDRLEYIRGHGHCDKPGFSAVRAAVQGDWQSAACILDCPSDLIS